MRVNMVSLLDHLRTQSQVDCDTLDADVVSSLGPFVDCTSNQAIAYLELTHTRHEGLLKKAIEKASELKKYYADVNEVSLAVDIAVSSVEPNGRLLVLMLLTRSSSSRSQYCHI